MHAHRDHRRGSARLEHLRGHRDGTRVGSAEEVGGDGERVGGEAGRVGGEATQRRPDEQHQQQAAVRFGSDGPEVAQLGAELAVAERFDRNGGPERRRGDTRLHDLSVTLPRVDHTVGRATSRSTVGCRCRRANSNDRASISARS